VQNCWSNEEQPSKFSRSRRERSTRFEQRIFHTLWSKITSWKTL